MTELEISHKGGLQFPICVQSLAMTSCQKS